VQTELSVEDDRGSLLAARSPNTLTRADDGDRVELDVTAEARFIAWDDAVLVARVDWFENDTGGVHQFDRRAERRLAYDRGRGCWVDVAAGRSCIAGRSGEIASGTLFVDQPAAPGGHDCVVELDWSLWVR